MQRHVSPPGEGRLVWLICVAMEAGNLGAGAWLPILPTQREKVLPHLGDHGVKE